MSSLSLRFIEKESLSCILEFFATHNVSVEVVLGYFASDSKALELFVTKLISSNVNLLPVLTDVQDYDALSLTHALELHFTTKLYKSTESPVTSVISPPVLTWLQAQPKKDVDALLALIWTQYSSEHKEGFSKLLTASIQTLCYLIVADGLRLPKIHPLINTTFDFVALGAVLNNYCQDPSPSNTGATYQVLKSAQSYLSDLKQSQLQSGVSLKLGYHISKLEHCIKRLFLILRLRREPLHLYSFLIASIDDRPKLSSIVARHTSLLFNHLIDYTSFLGSHYVLEKKHTYYQLFKAALGGGAITGLTCLIKLGIPFLKLPPLIDGLLTGFVYATSFVVIYILHFTLATKQPATTSAALVTALKASPLSDQKPIQTFLGICRSQTVSILGNLLMVVPVVYIILTVGHLLFERSIFSFDTGTQILQKHDLLNSYTTIYALITGFVLYVCSLAGGYIQNVAQLFQLNQRVQHSRWKAYTINHIGGLSTSVILGFALGLTPIIGYLTGLPIDIRHVTLSSGNITAGFTSIGSITTEQFFWSLASVFTIGLFNLGVSFSIGLSLSVLSQNITVARTTRFFKKAFGLLLKRPYLILHAPKGKNTPLE